MRRPGRSAAGEGMKSSVGRRRGSGWDKSHRSSGGAAEQAAVFAQEFVEDHTSSGGHIEGVLGAEHRDADVGVAAGGNPGADAVDFVSEDDADRESGDPVEEVDSVEGGFDGGQLVAAGGKGTEDGDGVPGVLPGDGFFGAEGGLTDGAFRRVTGDTGEVELFGSGGVGSAEEGADVV